QLVFGLRGELRVRHLAREHRGQSLAAIVTRERDLFFPRAAGGLCVLRDLAGERPAKAGEVSTTVALRNVVRETKYAFVVAVVPPQRAFDRDAFALGLDHDRLGNQRSLVTIEEFHE